MSINNNSIHRRGNTVVLGVDMWNWKERKTSLWELLVEWYWEWIDFSFMSQLTCGASDDYLWFELSWHQFKQNESSFHWKGMSVLNKNGCILGLKCDSVYHLSNRKIRSDLTQIKTSMIYFFEWWEGKDLNILKVREKQWLTFIIIEPCNSLSIFFVWMKYYIFLKNAISKCSFSSCVPWLLPKSTIFSHI